MAETDTHRRELIATLFALEERYRGDHLVYVAADLLLYYEEDNIKASLAPDVFVVFGVAKGERRIYKLWEEGKAPAVVFEFTSRGTRRKDLSEKRLRYEALGVQEYFLFDPLAEYLNPRLQGFRLDGRYYRPLPPWPLAEGEWQLESRVLNLELHTEGTRLRLFDPEAGAYLLSPHEEAEARREAEVRAKAAEAEMARLQAELARLRGDFPDG